jgi:hypothetical protein
VLYPENTVSGYSSPFAVGPNPQFRMYLLLRYNFTLQYVAHEKVVVHRLTDDLGDRGGFKLNKPVMLRPAGLSISLAMYLSQLAELPSCFGTV